MPSSPKAQVAMPIGGSKLQRAEDKQKFEFKQIPRNGSDVWYVFVFERLLICASYFLLVCDILLNRAACTCQKVLSLLYRESCTYCPSPNTCNVVLGYVNEYFGPFGAASLKE